MLEISPRYRFTALWNSRGIFTSSSSSAVLAPMAVSCLYSCSVWRWLQSCWMLLSAQLIRAAWEFCWPLRLGSVGAFKDWRAAGIVLFVWDLNSLYTAGLAFTLKRDIQHIAIIQYFLKILLLYARSHFEKHSGKYRSTFQHNNKANMFWCTFSVSSRFSFPSRYSFSQDIVRCQNTMFFPRSCAGASGRLPPLTLTPEHSADLPSARRPFIKASISHTLFMPKSAQMLVCQYFVSAPLPTASVYYASFSNRGKEPWVTLTLNQWISELQVATLALIRQVHDPRKYVKRYICVTTNIL